MKRNEDDHVWRGLPIGRAGLYPAPGSLFALGCLSIIAIIIALIMLTVASGLIPLRDEGRTESGWPWGIDPRELMVFDSTVNVDWEAEGIITVNISEDMSYFLYDSTDINVDWTKAIWDTIRLSEKR